MWDGLQHTQPLPEFSSELPLATAAAESVGASPPDRPAAAAFTDVTEDVGLQHQFQVAPKAIEKRFTMHQSFGGGVAVLDYDGNGFADLYFAQGAAEHPTYVATASDQLYRNLGGNLATGEKRVLDVSQHSGIQERSYTLGVTAGDWNQDGWIDLALANIGANQLLINQGDGTFQIQPLDQTDDFELMTTSLAMADVTGDHLPDLIALNYFRDPEIAKVPEVDADGNVTNSLLPHSFDAALDTLYTSVGDGGHQASLVGDAESDTGTGLGILVTNLDESAGNEVFVANDAQRNQLWRRTGEQWVDAGAALGCAYGSRGSATGAMGIAAADWDRTGTLDMLTTNFIEEPNSLYVSRQGLFRDLNVRFKLNQVSLSMVGFGCQAIDYSNNGWSDLIVTNGHVDDLDSQGQAFRQPLQLIANLGDQFGLVSDVDGSFWKQPHLGRALATLDYNRDGSVDCVITDLLERSVLLQNDSLSLPGNDRSEANWLQIKLVGTNSERDAIGAKVVVETDQAKWTQWVTAGDGYLCKNESIAHFGLGAASAVNSIKVTWPNGQVQSFDGSAKSVNCRILLVEAQDQWFVLLDEAAAE